jgi:hypothetical protein
MHVLDRDVAIAEHLSTQKILAVRAVFFKEEDIVGCAFEMKLLRMLEQMYTPYYVEMMPDRVRRFVSAQRQTRRRIS